jgi:(1->4)-alpha-D-glucan 1-alpha-D-glucosylmutase
MIASTTHDTKRSEDVRARIAALSEMPDAWDERLVHWQQLNTDKRAVRDSRPIPDGNVEYLIYQTMLGAWPFDPAAIESFHQRLNAYLIKAVREAKEHSSWVEPDTVYEETLTGFVDALFDRQRSNAFLSDFTEFQRRIARAGALNSLSQTLIKLTAPGIPDIYQGNELWDFSLVDPDNRRPVDYARRAQLLAELDAAQSGTALLHNLTTHWQDGRIKLFLLQTALDLRQRHPDLFAHGDYSPIQLTGDQSEHIFAYVRTHQDTVVITVAPRRCSTVLDDGEDLMALGRWGDTTLTLPDGWSGPARDLFTGEVIPTVNVLGVASLRLSDVFRHFPVGLVGNDATIERASTA